MIKCTMKKSFHISDTVSIAIIIFNFISTICFLLPAGRAYYMPEFLEHLTIMLFIYAAMGGMGISGVAGSILNVITIAFKKTHKVSIVKNVVYLVLFLLTIPFAYLLFCAAMSV